MECDSRHEDFVRLLAVYQGRVYSYIMTLVFDWSTADEIFQETCVVLWQKFDQFDPDTDFARWACRVAHLNVLKWREQHARRREVCSDAFLQSLESTQQRLGEEFDERRHALEKCLHKLRREDRDLLHLRYERDCTAKDVAQQLGRSVGAIYQALHRIRRSLLSCLRLRLAQEESQ